MGVRLRRFLDVRPGEGWPVLVTFLYIGFAVASFTLAKPIRQGLFIGQFGAYKLAYAYVAVPLVLAVFVPIYGAIAARVGQRLVFTGSLLFLGANVLAFWYGLRFHAAPWLSAAFYVWVNCYGVIAPVQAWTFANTVFDTRQARRLFGVVGSGASFGAIVGGLLAQTLVVPLGGTVNLMLVLAGLILATAVLVSLAWRVRRRDVRTKTKARAEARPGRISRLVWQTPYLRLLAALVFLVAVVTQWTGFQFQLVLSEYFLNDADQITRALGKFNFIMGLVAFGVQILLTGRLLRNFGIALTIMLLPIALGVGSALTILWPGVLAVVLTNTFDQGLRYGLDRSTFELLYLPLASDVRSRVKSFIDLVVNRWADAFGGVAVAFATRGIDLAALHVAGLDFGLRGLAAMSFAGALAWAFVAWRLRSGYVDAIRESIQQHRLDVARTVPTVLDRSATDALAGKLQAGNPDEILYALGLFEMQHRGQLHPAVRGLLSHPTAAVRRRALALLDDAADTSVIPQVEALLRDPDLDTRTEALLFLAHHAQADPLLVIRNVPDFPEYSIQAGMIAFLCRPGPLQNVEAAGFLLDNLVEETADTASKIEAARLIARVRGPFEPHLRRLITDAEPQVRTEAIRAAGESAAIHAVPELVRLLGDPAFNGEAAEALVAMGPAAVPDVCAALDDEHVSIESRREVPSVLARLGSAQAHQALYDHLLVSDINLRFRVITALSDVRRAQPGIVMDRQAIEMVLAAEIMGHYRSYQILGTIGDAFAGNDPVVAGLRHSMEQERERIFRLTSLLRDGDDVENAYRGLSAESATVRANALELLDTVLSPDMRRLLVPLVDPQVTVAERISRANRLVGTSVESREEAVEALIASDDPWMRSCGVYAVGALRLTGLADRIERYADSDDPLLRETVRAARHRLEAPAGELLVHAHDEGTGPVTIETGFFDVRIDGGGVG